jgi:hypothetical protein
MSSAIDFTRLTVSRVLQAELSRESAELRAEMRALRGRMELRALHGGRAAGARVSTPGEPAAETHSHPLEAALQRLRAALDTALQ